MPWPIKKLGEVARIEGGGTPSTKNPLFWNGDIPWLTPKELSDFRDKEINDTERKITKAGLERTRLFPAGTVLFSSRAPIGYIAIAGIQMATNQGFKNFICNEKILTNGFLYYFLRFRTKFLQSLGRGATFTEISRDILSKVEISVPPLATQKQIVERLDKIARAQKLNDGLIQKTDELFQSLLHKELNPVRDSKHSNGVNPAGPADAKAMAGKKNWEIKKMVDLINPQYGYTTSAKDSGNYRFIRITDIGNEGELRDSDKKYVTISQDEAKSYQLRNGDLLLARTGATFGKILYFEEGEPAIFASFLIRLNPDTSIDPFYIWLFSRSQDYWQQARSLMTGSGQPQFNANRLKQIKIPLPPLEIQKQIVAKLSAIQNYKKQLLGQKAKLKELFDSALAKSMSKDA
mgnify:FL=1